jgi:integrase
MATIKKRSWKTGAGETKEAWQLRYVDGQGVRRSKQFERKGDASAYLTKAGWQISQGIHTADSASITIGEAADLWVEAAKKPSRRRAKAAERSTIKQYEEMAPYPAAARRRKAVAAHHAGVKAYVDALLETRSKAMAGKAVRALSSIIKEAQERGLVAQNVAKGVKVIRSKREKKKIVIPPKEDLRAMLEAAEADYPDFYPLLLTAIFAGFGRRNCAVCRALAWIFAVARLP